MHAPRLLRAQLRAAPLLLLRAPSRRMSSQKRALLPVAPGSEDIETVCISDVLRRAGVHVDLAAVATPPGGTTLTLARGVVLTADLRMDDVPTDAAYDLIALPGGMPGATHLAGCARLTALLRAQVAAGRWVGAICASPSVVLAAHGLLTPHTRATAHASVAELLPNTDALEQRVVVHGCVVTSRGPGTSIEFALQLVACLLGADKAAAVAAPLHLAPGQAERVLAV